MEPPRGDFKAYRGRVVVEAVSVLPIVYSNKCKAYCVVVQENPGSQISEYPGHVVREQERIAEYFNRLSRDFRGMVELKIVNPFSLRGLYLSLRHGSSSFIVVNGRRRVGLEEGYERLREVVESEIRVQRGL